MVYLSNFENNSDKVSEKYIAIESFLFQKISCYLPLSNKEMSTREQISKT